MILTHDVILREIKADNIKIEPFEAMQTGPASVDLHLGNLFRIFKRHRDVVQVTGAKLFGPYTGRKDMPICVSKVRGESCLYLIDKLEKKSKNDAIE